MQCYNVKGHTNRTENLIEGNAREAKEEKKKKTNCASNDVNLFFGVTLSQLFIIHVNDTTGVAFCRMNTF